MTRNEAINFLKIYRNEELYTEECRNAHEMAIEALQKEPCNDCIRRSDIGLTDFEIVMCNGDYKEGLKMLLDKIEKAPSVMPQPKMGRWARELIRNEYGGCIGAKMICSECGQDNGYDKRMKFCPNCGCKMQEVEND